MLADGDISGAPLGGRQCLFSDRWVEVSVRVRFGLPVELWENEMCFLQSMVIIYLLKEPFYLIH